MKKGIIFLVMTMLAVMAMTACGSKNNSTNTTVTPAGTLSTNLYHPCGGEITLGQYKGLKYTMESAEVTDADVQEQIDLLLKEYPNYAKDDAHTDMIVKEDDIVNMDYVGKVAGVAFDRGTATDQYLDIANNTYIPGFASALVGKTMGTTFDIDVTFPESYPNNPELAGVAAVFTITLNHFGKKVNTIDDAYVAKYAYTVATTVDGLKAYFRDKLKEAKEEEVDEKMWDALIAQVIDNSEFKTILQEDVDYYYNLSTATLRQYAQAAGMTEEELYNYYYGNDEMTYAEFVQKCREQAERSVKEFMVLQAIVKTENITFTAEEYASMAEEYRLAVGASTVADMENSYGKEYIEYCILNDKALDLIHDTAEITKP
ncbi:MAG: trigger factor [Lachnospiraceae bacterium]|nr:trigger factor [Lachnospiraceae bacterium]